MNINKKKTIINCVIIIFYIIAHIVLIAHHEAWGDEAQAWNIAKNTSFFGLFPALCAEGHPAGWFVVIKIAQTLGLSFYNFSYLSLFLMACALGLFLFLSPLPIAVNIVTALSSCFCYFNPAISRVYSLAVLVITLIASIYNRRKESPIIFGILVFILFQTHILLAGLASALMIIMIYDSIKDHKMISGAVISALGFIVTVLELFPRETVVKSVDYSLSDILLNTSFQLLIEKLNLIPNALFTSFSFVWWVVLLIIITAVVVELIITRKKNFDVLFIAICSFGFIIGVNSFIYQITIHAATLLIAICILIAWILYPRIDSKEFKTITVSLLVVISLGSIHTWVRSARSDYLKDFSENKKMADYICSNLEENSVIIMKDEKLARAGVYAYVSSKRPDIIFWCPDTNNEYTFYNWSTDISPIDNDTAITITKKALPDADDIYLISWHEENTGNITFLFAANDYCEKNDPSWLYYVN